MLRQLEDQYMITDHSRFLFTEKRSGTDHDSTRNMHGEGPWKEGLKTEGNVMGRTAMAAKESSF